MCETIIFVPKEVRVLEESGVFISDEGVSGVFSGTSEP